MDPSVVQLSTLLALPYDIRIFIYKELLNPRPNAPLLLYSDQSGRAKPLRTYPSILQVNRQIYSEAAPILYDCNRFQIHVASTSSRACTIGFPRPVEPASFFRSFPDASDPNELPSKFGYREDYELDQWSPAQATCHGLIYPHCLRRIRHLELVTSQSAVIGSGRMGSRDFFSQTGQLILEILRTLAAENLPAGVTKKSFNLVDKVSGHLSNQPMFRRNVRRSSKIESTFKGLEEELASKERVKTAIIQNKFYRIRREMIALLYAVKETRELAVLQQSRENESPIEVVLLDHQS